MQTNHTSEPYGHESSQSFEERVIASVLLHAEQNLYLSPTELDFHNSEHMHFVYEKVQLYADYAEKNGLVIDRFALSLAAILHDANYYENLNAVNQKLSALKLISQPFANKEEYSAWTARQLLESHGVHADTVKKVQQLIMATHVHSLPQTVEEKIIVRSDLDNISGDDQIFIMNTLRLVREAEKLDGPKNPLERISFLFSILNNYVAKDLCLGEFDKDACKQTFLLPAMANINRIADDTIKTTLKRLGNRAISLLPSLGDSD